MKATVNEMWSRAEIERLVEKCDKRGRSICSGGLALGEDGMLLSKAAAALGECLPDERVGRCWCEKCVGWVWGVPCWDDVICEDWLGCSESGCPRSNDEGDPAPCGTDDPQPQWLYEADHSWGTDAWGTHPAFCPNCGAHLGTDGIARRNAAAGQVERVLEALGECEHAGRICLDSGIGQGGDSYLIWWCTQCGAVASDRREAGHDEWIKGGFLQVNTPQTTKAIRAALDGGAPDATHD